MNSTPETYLERFPKSQLFSCLDTNCERRMSKLWLGALVNKHLPVGTKGAHLRGRECILVNVCLKHTVRRIQLFCAGLFSYHSGLKRKQKCRPLRKQEDWHQTHPGAPEQPFKRKLSSDPKVDTLLFRWFCICT